MTEASSGTIMTYTGKWIDPLFPLPEDIDIRDIAHSLSNQCRFTGHTRHFYSVAQHSCLVSDICPNEHKLGGLLHDGTEAYLSDLARPIKIQPGFGQSYRKVEHRLMVAIEARYGVRLDADAIKEADNALLKTEIRDLMPIGTFPLDGGTVEPLKAKIKTWSPSRAKKEFMDRFLALYLGEYGPLLYSEVVS